MPFRGGRGGAARAPSLLPLFYWSEAVPIKAVLGGDWPAAARRPGRRGGGESAGPGAGEPAAAGAEAVSAALEPPLSIAFPFPSPPVRAPPSRPSPPAPASASAGLAPCQRHRRSPRAPRPRAAAAPRPHRPARRSRPRGLTARGPAPVPAAVPALPGLSPPSLLAWGAAGCPAGSGLPAPACRLSRPSVRAAVREGGSLTGNTPASGDGAAAAGFVPGEFLLAPGRGEALEPPQAIVSVDLCDGAGDIWGRRS